MVVRRKRTDAQVEQIRDALERHYCPEHPRAKVDVYRYNSASIRVRIIDPDFAGKSLTARDTRLWEILEEALPEETLSEINLLLLLTPAEAQKSLMNQEFEDPTPTRL
jgi:stress-induced morphogen